jgi:hypothetical protein
MDQWRESLISMDVEVMSEVSNSTARLGRAMREWVESVPTTSPEAARREAGRLRRVRRRRRVSAGALSVIVVAAAITGSLSLDLGGSRRGGSADSATVDPSRPNGCSIPAELFGGGFTSEVTGGRAQLFGMPADAIVSVVEGASIGREGMINVVSVDDAGSLSEEQLERLRSADGREILVVERCGEVRTISALESDLRNARVTLGGLSAMSSLTIEIDDRRGLVVITGPRVLADQLVSATGGDASFIEFRSESPVSGD